MAIRRVGLDFGIAGTPERFGLRVKPDQPFASLPDGLENIGTRGVEIVSGVPEDDYGSIFGYQVQVLISEVCEHGIIIAFPPDKRKARIGRDF